MGNRDPGVDTWFETYDDPQKELVQAVRRIILDADPRVTETIKWKSPTFMYKGNLASQSPATGPGLRRPWTDDRGTTEPGLGCDNRRSGRQGGLGVVRDGHCTSGFRVYLTRDSRLVDTAQRWTPTTCPPLTPAIDPAS